MVAKSKILALLILGTILLPSLAFAQDGLGIEDFKIQDLLKIAGGLACWATSAASLLVVIFMVYAGVKFFTAKGDANKAGEARRMFLQVFIAAVVIFGVGVIISTVANALGADISIVPFSC